MSFSNSELPNSMLFCKLCRSLYRQPRILTCLHSFCYDCLRHLNTGHDTQGQTILACPVCYQTTILSSEGISSLTSNDFLARVCREYVGEVQKTLIIGHPLSPRLLPSLPSEHPQPSVRQDEIQAASITVPNHHQHVYGQISVSPHARFQDLATASPSRQDAFSYDFQHRAPGPYYPDSVTSSVDRGYSPNEISPARHHSVSETSGSDVVQMTARRLSAEIASHGGTMRRRMSTLPPDVSRTWDCLQHKLNYLQTAALQVTYGLENVNIAESTWHQRKQDLRRQVQRRSAQLQFFIKRQERLLLAALDARRTDEAFLTAADHARHQLRANLKSLMHEVNTLRSVFDLATDAELMSLSSLLLTSSVSQNPVVMTTPELRLVVPENVSLEDMISRDFGCLTSSHVTNTIYTPEELDMSSLDESISEEDPYKSESMSLSGTSITATLGNGEDQGEDHDGSNEENEDEEMMVVETLEMVDGKMQVVSRQSVPVPNEERQSRSRKKDSGSLNGHNGKAEVKSLKQASSPSSPAACSTGQTSPLSSHAGTGTTTCTDNLSVACSLDSSSSRREQSLERFHNIRENLRQKRRELLLNHSDFTRQMTNRYNAHVMPKERRVQSLDRTQALHHEDRDLGTHFSPQRHPTSNLAAPLIHVTSRPESHLAHHPHFASQVLYMEMDAGPTSPTFPITSSEHSSRPVRRAMSAASDRASKMEYLRETWRKRKEILIQNEAFISSAFHDDHDDEEEDHETAASGDHKNGASPQSVKPAKVRQSLKSRFSNLKQALMKNGKHDEASKTVDKDADSKTGNNSSPISVKSDKALFSVRTNGTQKPEKAEKSLDKVPKRQDMPLPPIPTSQSVSPPTTHTAPPTHVSSSPEATYVPPSSAKPSMMVKPRPRDHSPTATPPPGPLETVSEDAEKTQAERGEQRSGLRVTSPSRGGEESKHRLQQVKANVRRKKERWRSLSLT